MSHLHTVLNHQVDFAAVLMLRIMQVPWPLEDCLDLPSNIRDVPDRCIIMPYTLRWTLQCWTCWDILAFAESLHSLQPCHARQWSPLSTSQIVRRPPLAPAMIVSQSLQQHFCVSLWRALSDGQNISYICCWNHEYLHDCHWSRCSRCDLGSHCTHCNSTALLKDLEHS